MCRRSKLVTERVGSLTQIRMHSLSKSLQSLDSGSNYRHKSRGFYNALIAIF